MVKQEPKRQKIGLLGGSFNPAHQGHIYISVKAYQKLGLDKIWWLVTPQNPLKSKDDMASYGERVEYAKSFTQDHDQIIISDFEKKADTRYSYDTIKALYNNYPEYDFVWIIGADNMIEFSKWRRWEDIVNMVPIAIFNRANYQEDAYNSDFANKFAKYAYDKIDDFMSSQAPAWIFINIKPDFNSATNIRKNKSSQKI